MPSAKKQIVIAVILAILAIVTVLLLMNSRKGPPANELVFLRDGEEYSQNAYQMDDNTLKFENGEELQLNLVVYLKEKEEFQFGFSLPESEEIKDKEPFTMELVDAETGEPATEKPFFICEPRDGVNYYRAVVIGTKIDVDTPSELRLNVFGIDGEALYSDVFISTSTIFTEKPLSELPVAEDTISLQSSSGAA